MDNTKEYITSAAIWYKELPLTNFLPTNVEKGIVISGHRHSHCIDVVKTLSGLRTVKLGPDSVGETIQGFMTNKNRFVDRNEAMLIAIKSFQVKEEDLYNPRIGLFSEDLY